MFQLQIISFHAWSSRRIQVASDINSVIFPVSPVNVTHEGSVCSLRLLLLSSTTCNAEGSKCERLNHSLLTKKNIKKFY